jgi:hypothetical protein
MLRNRALLFALFIGFMGLLPSIIFSFNTGALHYATSAWDEDIYTQYLLTHQDAVYRLFSNVIARGFHALFGTDLAFILMDTLIPAITAVIAVFLAHALGFTQRKHWLLASFLVLIPMETLTISHPYFWQEFFVKISPFAGEYPEGFRKFVPSIYQNFFSIYKAPEPLFTLAVHLFALYGLLRYSQTSARKYVFMLLLVAAVLPFIYVTTGVTLLLFAGAYAVLGLLITKQKRFIGWLVATLVVAGYVVAAHVLFPKLNSPELTFKSHLPVIGASTLYGLFGLWVVWRNWGFKPTGNGLLAAAAFAVPIAALNQQIITGTMVQSRAWEYYSNYPFIAFGLLLIWPQIMGLFGAGWQTRLRKSVRFVTPLLVILFIVAQFMTTKGYQKGDLVALGYADGIKAAEGFTGPVVLDNPNHDSQVWLRVGRPDLQIIGGYEQIIQQPIARLGAPNYQETYETMKDQAFTFFDRKGHSPYELQELIKEDIGKGSWNVRNFFSMLDCWYPLSDYRHVNPDAMLERIPDIIADYHDFLNDPKRRTQYGEVLYLSETPIEELRDDIPWVNQKVAMIIEGKWRQKTVYVYRQVPKGLEK